MHIIGHGSRSRVIRGGTTQRSHQLTLDVSYVITRAKGVGSSARVPRDIFRFNLEKIEIVARCLAALYRVQCSNNQQQQQQQQQQRLALPLSRGYHILAVLHLPMLIGC